jgi:hypothetical protein
MKRQTIGKTPLMLDAKGRFKGNPDPDPPKDWTREEILAYAAELGKKYQSVMEYRADIKPMNFADVKNRRRF